MLARSERIVGHSENGPDKIPFVLTAHHFARQARTERARHLAIFVVNARQTAFKRPVTGNAAAQSAGSDSAVWWRGGTDGLHPLVARIAILLLTAPSSGSLVR